jgi:hypothetical protein
MTKTEAASILATYITVQARKFGIRQITKTFIEDQRTNALHEGGQITKAAERCPHWTTIRTAGRKGSA